MDDREAIAEVLASYATTFDGRDADAFAALYTDDAVLITPDGRELKSKETFAKLIRNTPPNDLRHLPEAAEITIDGDTAAATSRYRAVSARGEMTGSYEDELRRTPDGWRLTRRKVLVDPR